MSMTISGPELRTGGLVANTCNHSYFRTSTHPPWYSWECAMKSMGLMVKGSTPFGYRRPAPFRRNLLRAPQQRVTTVTASYRPEAAAAAAAASSTCTPPPPVITSDLLVESVDEPSKGPQILEEGIEKLIYRCRFMTFLGVAGSLMGSIICFLKGCVYVTNSFTEYFVNGGKVILMLVEAIDIYLIGTVMFIFGMGLYELFISNLDIAKSSSHRSNLFGMFTLVERPEWLEIQSVNELKTKIGHVIVMALVIGLFEKSKKVTISSPRDLLCLAASVFLSSGCLYLLSKLHTSKRSKHA